MIGVAVVTVAALGAGVGLVVRRRRARMRRAKGGNGGNTVAVDPMRVLVGGAAAGGGADVVNFRPQVESQRQVLREEATKAAESPKGFAPSVVRLNAEELFGGGSVKRASESPPYQVPVKLDEM
jgi:hypothetical protein